MPRCLSQYEYSYAMTDFCSCRLIFFLFWVSLKCVHACCPMFACFPPAAIAPDTDIIIAMVELSLSLHPITGVLRCSEQCLLQSLSPSVNGQLTPSITFIQTPSLRINRSATTVRNNDTGFQLPIHIHQAPLVLPVLPSRIINNLPRLIESLEPEELCPVG